MTIYVVITLVIFYLKEQVIGECIYQKYFQRILIEEHISVYASFVVRRSLDCEKICLENGAMCRGANVIVSGTHHTCSLISDIPTTITEDLLMGKRNSKLIVKTIGICNEVFPWRRHTTCYNLSVTTFKYTDAIEYCQSLGSELISIEEMDEFIYIQSILRGNGQPWTSGKRQEKGGTFTWISGVELPIDSPMWADNEPSSTNIKCVQLWVESYHYLDDIGCSNERLALCELQQ